MSLKNIEAVLHWVARGDAPDELSAAVDELEALKKACLMLYQTGVVHNERGEEHETTPALDNAADYLMNIGMEQMP